MNIKKTQQNKKTCKLIHTGKKLNETGFDKEELSLFPDLFYDSLPTLLFEQGNKINILKDY